MVCLLSSLPLHEQQLQFMTELAANRPSFLNPLFHFLNYFDTPYFFFVLVPVLLLGFSYQWGLRIFYWAVIDGVVNSAVKILVGWPRPSTDLPELGLFHPTTNGFPSGGAETCMFFGILLIYYWRTKAARIIGITYIALISFSRLYLGVHYPIDVLGGWTLGIILAFLFIRLKKPIDRFLAKQDNSFCLMLGLIASAAIAFSTPDMRFLAGAMAGISIGTYLSLEYGLFLPAARNFTQGASRAILGMAIILLVDFLWPHHTPLSSKLFVISLFLTFAASPICKWIIRH